MLNSTYYTEGLLHDIQVVTANNKIITVTVDPSTGGRICHPTDNKKNHFSKSERIFL